MPSLSTYRINSRKQAGLISIKKCSINHCSVVVILTVKASMIEMYTKAIMAAMGTNRVDVWLQTIFSHECHILKSIDHTGINRLIRSIIKA